MLFGEKQYLFGLHFSKPDSRTSEVVGSPLEGGKRRDRKRPQMSENQATLQFGH